MFLLMGRVSALACMLLLAFLAACNGITAQTSNGQTSSGGSLASGGQVGTGTSGFTGTGGTLASGSQGGTGTSEFTGTGGQGAADAALCAFSAAPTVASSPDPTTSQEAQANALGLQLLDGHIGRYLRGEVSVYRGTAKAHDNESALVDSIVYGPHPELPWWQGVSVLEEVALIALVASFATIPR